jgi:hypothetical protein
MKSVLIASERAKIAEEISSVANALSNQEICTTAETFKLFMQKWTMQEFDAVIIDGSIPNLTLEFLGMVNKSKTLIFFDHFSDISPKLFGERGLHIINATGDKLSSSLYNFLSGSQKYTTTNDVSPVNLADGELLIKSCNTNEAIYFLKEGTLTRVFNGKVIDTITKGQVIGELNYFADVSKEITGFWDVIAQEPCTLIRIPYSKVESELGKMADGPIVL